MRLLPAVLIIAAGVMVSGLIVSGVSYGVFAALAA